MFSDDKRKNIRKIFAGVSIYIIISNIYISFALFGLAQSIVVSVALFGLGGVLIRNGILKLTNRYNVVSSIMLAIIAAYPLLKLLRWIRVDFDVAVFWVYIFLIGTVLVPTYIINCLVIRIFTDRKQHIKDNYSKTLFWVLPFWIQLFVVVPITVQKNNLVEYSFSVCDTCVAAILPLVLSVLISSLIISMLGEKIRKFVSSFFGIFYVLGYLQFNFMNGYLGLLNGEGFHLKKHLIVGGVNLAIWLMLFAAFLLFYNISKREKLCRYIVLFASLAQLVTFIITISLNFNDNFSRRFMAYTYENRFDVAKNQNVILFCFDAVDNSFLKKLCEEGYDFSDFSDFTMYDNTCSVFDVTDLSMAQIATASNFELNNNYPLFYEKMKDNNFNIRFYNYDGTYEVPIEYYVDNYMETDPDHVSVTYSGIIIENFKLAMYLLAPYIVKEYINVDRLDFNSQVYFGKVLENNYLNQAYMNNLILNINDQYENSFIYDHVNGAHQPCGDFMDATRECMDIAREYVGQLKKLGVYDDATIIFISDHGIHDDSDYEHYPTAGTPVFLIKGRGEKHDKMVRSNAPIYHTDILSTILTNVGCYDEEDYSLFGPSIYYFHDGDVRERIWYNRVLDGAGYYRCSYRGDTEELERKVNNGEYDVVDHALR